MVSFTIVLQLRLHPHIWAFSCVVCVWRLVVCVTIAIRLLTRGSRSSRIHLSIMFFEIFTVFVPCYLVVRQNIQIKRAVAANTKWENSSQMTQTTLVGSPSLSIPADWKKAMSDSDLEKGDSNETLAYNGHSNRDSSGDCLLTMQALNRVLSDNPVALQEFSALRDFSGENIAFLTRLASWKESWPQQHAAACTEDELRDAFAGALAIYTDLISPRDAEFPINLSSQELRDLEAVFEGPARIICGEARVNTALPFERASSNKGPSSSSGASSSSPDRGLSSRDSNDTSSGSSRIEFGAVVDRVRYMGDISEGFTPRVFDAAERNVKYLVLTNTWPKFVHETQRRQSFESERSDATDASESSIITRVASVMRSFL